LPLSTPALASYATIVFIIARNDLVIPLILNNRAEFMMLPVMIASLVGDVFAFFNLSMAICVITQAPTVMLVLFLPSTRRPPPARRRDTVPESQCFASKFRAIELKKA
jgi:ABC-type glycerol-3-phosphate transport system permease component